MALITADRVKETSTTTGTGSITLAGAVAGFRAFDTPMDTGDTCYYCIAQQTPGEWEVGLGTFTSPSTLARTTPISGSAATPVSFSAGTKDVFITFPATIAQQSTAGGFGHQVGPRCYSSIDLMGSTLVSVVMATASDSRFHRVTMAETGNLRDISVLVLTQSGNVKIGVYDTGHANGTHSTRTQLAISSGAAVPAPVAWHTYDPNLAVVAGDTLDFHLSFDNTTAAVFGVSHSGAAQATLPTSFYPPSGLGTASPKLTGLTASFYASPPATITEANMTAAGKTVLFIWRIS